MTPVRLEPTALRLESSTLPLGHSAPILTLFFVCFMLCRCVELVCVCVGGEGGRNYTNYYPTLPLKFDFSSAKEAIKVLQYFSC